MYDYVVLFLFSKIFEGTLLYNEIFVGFKKNSVQLMFMIMLMNDIVLENHLYLNLSMKHEV